MNQLDVARGPAENACESQGGIQPDALDGCDGTALARFKSRDRFALPLHCTPYIDIAHTSSTLLSITVLTQ